VFLFLKSSDFVAHDLEMAYEMKHAPCGNAMLGQGHVAPWVWGWAHEMACWTCRYEHCEDREGQQRPASYELVLREVGIVALVSLLSLLPSSAGWDARDQAGLTA
jgi:hypothetical protein